jgi:hypothetical protein
MFWARIKACLQRVGAASHRVWRWARALGRVVFLARVCALFAVLGVALLFDAQGQDALVILTDATTALHLKAFFIASLLLWGGFVWFWGCIAVKLDAHVEAALDGSVDERAHDFFCGWVPPAIAGIALVGANAALTTTLIDAHARLSGWLLLAFSAAASLILVVLLVRLLFVARRKRAKAGPSKSRADVLPTGWTDLKRPQKIWALVLFFLSAATLLLFSLLDPLDSAVLGSVVLFMLAACVWLAIPGFLTLRLYAYRVPVLAIAILLGLFFSLWNDNHDLRTMSRVDRVAAPDREKAHKWLSGRVSLDDAWRQWRTSQEPWPGYPEYVPIVVVTTAGGGIRAAVWTTEILGQLHSDLGAGFEKRLFAISAVSGGAFGSAVYLGLTKAGCLQKDADTIQRCARKVFERDLLAPVSANFFFKDTAQHFWPGAFRGDDRAAALERSFEAAFHDATGSKALSQPFHDLWTRPQREQRKDWPVLLMNGTSVGAGRRMIASNVRVERGPFGYAVDVFQILGEDAPVSTVANMAGRFPFVEPAGTMRFNCGRLPPRPANHAGAGEPDDPHLPASIDTLRKRCGQRTHPIVFDHIVDGGYFENFGATTADYLIDYLRELERTASPPDAALRGPVILFPIIIQISSDPDLKPREGVQSPATPAPEPLSWIQDLWAPLSGIFATRSARGEDSTYSLAQTAFGADLKQGAYFHLAMCNEPKPNPPLGWVMSKRAHDVIYDKMMVRCACNTAKILAIIGCLNGKLAPAGCAAAAYRFTKETSNCTN